VEICQSVSVSLHPEVERAPPLARVETHIVLHMRGDMLAWFSWEFGYVPSRICISALYQVTICGRVAILRTGRFPAMYASGRIMIETADDNSSYFS